MTITPRRAPWADSRQVFWSLALGVPTAILILRLWVEAGGSLPVTLVLAANVNPISLVTVLLTTASWLYSSVVVVALAISATLARSSSQFADTHPFIEWATTSPLWFRLSAFILALATWSLMYLPLLLLCVVAVVWPDQGRGLPGFLHWVVPKLLALGASVFLWPVINDAYRARLWFVLILLTAPLAGLLLGATGPLATRSVPWYWVGTRFAMAILLSLTIVPVLTTPILPLEVVVVNGAGGEVTPMRGHVIYVDDISTALLREQGGLEFIPNRDVQRRILCPDESDVPRYRLWIQGFHVEDSVLQALGRLKRPATTSDHWCHAALHP